MEKLDSHPTIIISLGDIAVYLLFAGTQIIWEVYCSLNSIKLDIILKS